MAVFSKFECNVCGNSYKTSRGLAKHLSIVKKYNASRPDLDTLPENTIQQFKDILVHYIHKRLPRGYKQLGKQTVLVPATESQFYSIFQNHIHFYSATKSKYKCIFHGSSSNQLLANILNVQDWGIKFYDQQQFEWKKQKNTDFNGHITQ
ncbi:4776_t:CDS:2, partial [Dentiscutata heterogama]